jgi:hypothetical protein
VDLFGESEYLFGDSISQIRMPAWSSGRVTLVGDAGFRTIGPTVMKTLIPRTPRQVWLTTQALRLVPRLPAALQRRLSAFQGRPARALQAVTLKRFDPSA